MALWLALVGHVVSTNLAAINSATDRSLLCIWSTPITHLATSNAAADSYWSEFAMQQQQACIYDSAVDV